MNTTQEVLNDATAKIQKSFEALKAVFIGGALAMAEPA